MKYKIIVDKQSRLNPSSEKREYEIDIEELRVKGDVYDSLVISKDESYIMRRLSLSEFYVLSVLEEPVKEVLAEINIELFEGDNYIYLVDMTGNKFYAEYLIRNEFNDLYVIHSEMNTAIRETAKEIELSVNQKLTNYSTTEEMNAAIRLLADTIALEVAKKVNDEDLTSANIILRINEDDSSEAQINADKIKLLANDILNILSNNVLNLTSKNIVIESTNLNVDKDGNMECNNAKITGGTIDLSSDNESVAKIKIKKTSNENSYVSLTNIGLAKYCNGKNVVMISEGKTSGEEDVFGYIDIKKINSNNQTSITDHYFHISNDDDETYVWASGIRTPSVTQTSLEENKKNFEKLDNDTALNIILDTDIYKYNLKSQADGAKKHIGFVIGDKYKYSEEITSENNDGVDSYSMISVAYGAIQRLYCDIQEQQEQIEELQKENKQNKDLIQSLLKRIERLEENNGQDAI